MNAQLTDWYPPEIKPVRVGYYLTYRVFKANGPPFKIFEGHQYWDGEAWRSAVQNKHWCGSAADLKRIQP